MDKKRLLDMLSMKDENDSDELCMIFSNNCDIGSSQGAMISVKAFDGLAKDIKSWHKKKDETDKKTMSEAAKIISQMMVFINDDGSVWSAPSMCFNKKYIVALVDKLKSESGRG